MGSLKLQRVGGFFRRILNCCLYCKSWITTSLMYFIAILCMHYTENPKRLPTNWKRKKIKNIVQKRGGQEDRDKLLLESAIRIRLWGWPSKNTLDKINDSDTNYQPHREIFWRHAIHSASYWTPNTQMFKINTKGVKKKKSSKRRTPESMK